MKKIWLVVLILIMLTGCGRGTPTPTPSPVPEVHTPTPQAGPLASRQAAGSQAAVQPTPSPVQATATVPATPAPTSCEGAGCVVATVAQAVAPRKVPEFSHIFVITLENREIGFVIGNSQMPNLNGWAGQYALLSQYYAVTHPSLPNYIAMIGGDTFGIKSDCSRCFVNATNLADQIETSKRTWKTYQEDMPSPCYVGDYGGYAQKHDPFIYFDGIRNDAERCQRSVVPLTQLDTDLANNDVPNYSFIVPNLCNSGHDCGLDVVDKWLGGVVGKIMASKAYDDHSLIVVQFDEGQGNHSCCGLGEEAGGQVATVLISPLVKPGTNDDTPYSHYSLLKTIETAWGLEPLGRAADPGTALIEKVWR